MPTLKATTRMVILEVLALDGEERSVEGLKVDDFRVSDKVGNSGSFPQAIASFRAAEPAYCPAALSELLSLPNRSRCWVDAVPSHYELAYYPSKESQLEGVHHITIKGRHGMNLIYRDGCTMTGAEGPAPSLSATPISPHAISPTISPHHFPMLGRIAALPLPAG